MNATRTTIRTQDRGGYARSESVNGSNVGRDEKEEKISMISFANTISNLGFLGNHALKYFLIHTKNYK